MKKYFIGFLVVIGALVVAWRLYLAFKDQQLLALFPRKDDRAAALASDNKDQQSLRAMRLVIPPSAQGVRTSIGMVDANPIGGNIATLPLVTDWNFSPLNN